MAWQIEQRGETVRIINDRPGIYLSCIDLDVVDALRFRNEFGKALSGALRENLEAGIDAIQQQRNET